MQADDRVTKILFSCPVYYIHFISTSVDSSPGKEAKHLEYAEGLPPYVAEYDTMGDRSSTTENATLINNSLGFYELLFSLLFTSSLPS